MISWWIKIRNRRKNVGNRGQCNFHIGKCCYGGIKKTQFQFHFFVTKNIYITCLSDTYALKGRGPLRIRPPSYVYNREKAIFGKIYDHICFVTQKTRKYLSIFIIILDKAYFVARRFCIVFFLENSNSLKNEYGKPKVTKFAYFCIFLNFALIP